MNAGLIIYLVLSSGLQRGNEFFLLCSTLVSLLTGQAQKLKFLAHTLHDQC